MSTTFHHSFFATLTPFPFCFVDVVVSRGGSRNRFLSERSMRRNQDQLRTENRVVASVSQSTGETRDAGRGTYDLKRCWRVGIPI